MNYSQLIFTACIGITFVFAIPVAILDRGQIGDLVRRAEDLQDSGRPSHGSALSDANSSGSLGYSITPQPPPGLSIGDFVSPDGLTSAWSDDDDESPSSSQSEKSDRYSTSLQPPTGLSTGDFVSPDGLTSAWSDDDESLSSNQSEKSNPSNGARSSNNLVRNSEKIARTSYGTRLPLVASSLDAPSLHQEEERSHNKRPVSRQQVSSTQQPTAVARSTKPVMFGSYHRAGRLVIGGSYHHPAFKLSDLAETSSIPKSQRWTNKQWPTASSSTSGNGPESGPYPSKPISSKYHTRTTSKASHDFSPESYNVLRTYLNWADELSSEESSTVSRNP